MTILYTLAELKAKRDRLNYEIDHFDQEKLWIDCFDKMSIHGLTFSRDSNNRLNIRIPRVYSIYSWQLPKGSFIINADDEEYIITVYDKPIEQLKQEFRD